MTHATKPVVTLSSAGLRFGKRHVWDDVNLELQPGEFLAVLGPNGSGKSSLLKVLLGMYPLTKGQATVSGSLGYVPQQKAFDSDLPIRGRDLVSFGVSGAEWGFWPSGGRIAARIEAVLKEVGALGYADKPIGKLSGGEQQRLRIAQALVSDPKVLLCDEPLLSLDLASQQAIAELIQHRRQQGSAVVFVTHEINPILPYVDRILYLVDGRWKLGTPDEVLTSHALSELYGTPVDVLRVRNRIVVIAGDETIPTELNDAHHHTHIENGGHH